MSRNFTKNVANYATYGANQIGPLLNGATKYAIAVWVRPASFSGTNNLNNNIISFGIGGGVTGVSIGIDTTGGPARVATHTRSVSSDARQVRVGTEQAVATGSWQLIGVDVDVSGKVVTPRCNGIADNSGSVTYGASTYTQGTSSNADRVGSDSGTYGPTGAEYQFDGDIAHVTIWKFTGSDAGLTQAEWNSLAAGANPTTIQSSKVALHTAIGGAANPETSDVGGLSLSLTGSVPAGSAAPPDSSTLSLGITGPSGGVVGVASSNFTVTATGTISGTMVVTPGDGGGGGSFTPATLSLSSGSPSGTFTYTPASTGAKSITLSNNGGASNPAAVNYTATASSSIALTDVADLRVIQRAAGVGSLAISGTHTGATSVQARVVLHGTNTVVVDWTTIAASLGASTFSGTLSGIPQGGWYNVQVRQGNATSVTATGSNRFGVGALYCFAGQSNAMQMFTIGSGTPSSTTCKLDGSGWTANTGAGAVTFANAMTAALGVPVGLVDTGYNAAALTLEGLRSGGYWLDLAGAPYTIWQARVTAAGGKVEALLWLQGEADGFQSVAGSTYSAGLVTLFSRLRTYLDQAGLPIFLAPLPRTTHPEADDAAWNVINDCILAAESATQIVAADTWDLPLGDTVHYSATGYATLALRMALSVRKYNGDAVQSRGPYIASARFSGSVVTLNLAHRSGSDFTPTSGITGMRFVANGSVITPTSVARTGAAQITATFPAAVVGPVTVAVAWGMFPDIAGAVVDSNSLPLSKTASAGIAATDGNRSVSLTLKIGSTPVANLSGLRWAWFDQATPDALLAPTDKGTGETTDAAGLLVIPLTNTTKAAGEVGWLIVTDSNGTTTQDPMRGYAGPVQVT